MREVDVLVVGSGINGLVAAALLARAGLEVEVLERNDRAGGAVASEQLTVPGFEHDTFSAWHPLFVFSPTFAELGEELERHGLSYANGERPAATAFGDGDAVVMATDPDRTEAGFEPDDAAAHRREFDRYLGLADLLGELLGSELRSAHAARLAWRLYRRLGRRGALAFGHEFGGSGRGWLEATFAGREPKALFAPWVLHTGLSPEDAGGWLALLGISVGTQLGGTPVVRGGSGRFVEAFEGLIGEHGGRIRTGVDVSAIRTRGGRAVGVLAGEEEIDARRGVIANVTPTQLYGRLLTPGAAPERAFEEAARYRYGRAGMQIHLALDGPLAWRDERLREVAIVNVTEGLDAVSLACAEAQAGLLPTAPTIAFGQPTTLDPSRAPAGKAIGWIQLLELPSTVRGDALGELAAPPGGQWTAELGEAYAQRVFDLVERQAPNLREVLLGHAVLTPADFERRNINLVGGDPYAGALTLDQHYLWRPLPSYGSHRTPVEQLWQCGASTFPGAGLSGASGRIAAAGVLGRRRRRPG